MAPPKLVSKEPTTLSISWSKVDGVEGYKVRFRAEDDPEWGPISSTTSVIKSELVKKKNLVEGKGYFCSVQPWFGSDAGPWSWSASSERLVPGVGLSKFIAQLLPKSLVKQRATIPTATALEGKVIGIYFSASWCGPCREFTPRVADVYNDAKRGGKPFEIVFISCDRDEKDWEAYYQGHHPWLSVDFNDSGREELMGKFNVRGIPRLCILRPTGEILEDNVGSMSLSSVDGWTRQCGL